MIYIFKQLEFNKTLQKIDLSSNEITYKALKDIFIQYLTILLY